MGIWAKAQENASPNRGRDSFFTYYLNTSLKGPLLPEKDAPIVRRYWLGKPLEQRYPFPAAGFQIRRVVRIIQCSQEELLLAPSKPLGILQKGRTSWAVRLNEVLLSNDFLKCGKVIKIEGEEPFLSRLIFRDGKFGPIRRFPALAAAVDAPSIVPIVNAQIFRVFH